MNLKILSCVLATGLLAGCHGGGENEAHQKTEHRAKQRQEEPSTEREQIESEVREGGLQDPGGAKSLREESAEQQKEMQDQVDQVDQQ